jgi:CheY-like chemotaxis protein
MTKFNGLYIVDDDETYQFIVQRMIAQSGLVNEVSGFLNGRDAIESLKSIAGKIHLIPDIILLDLTMPVMDGWQFIENYLLIKSRIGKKIHVYIVSSSVDPKDVEKAKNIEEVSDYVVKPITRDKFVDLIRVCA